MFKVTALLLQLTWLQTPSPYKAQQKPPLNTMPSYFSIKITILFWTLCQMTTARIQYSTWIGMC